MSSFFFKQLQTISSPAHLHPSCLWKTWWFNAPIRLADLFHVYDLLSIHCMLPCHLCQVPPFPAGLRKPACKCLMKGIQLGGIVKVPVLTCALGDRHNPSEAGLWLNNNSFSLKRAKPSVYCLNRGEQCLRKEGAVFWLLIREGRPKGFHCLKQSWQREWVYMDSPCMV